MIRRVLTALAATVPVLALGVFGVAPGALASSDGCRYPQVCIYSGKQMTRPTGRFRDVTAGWQWLGRSFGDRGFRNTRHDDVAFLLTTSGRVVCVPPGAHGGLFSGGVTAIRISYRSHC